jgi:hypothetical protein
VSVLRGLECSSLANLPNIVKCLRVRPGSTQVKQLSGAPLLFRLLVLPPKYKTRLEKLSKEKINFNSLRKFTNYDRKKFYNIFIKYVRKKFNNVGQAQLFREGGSLPKQLEFP